MHRFRARTRGAGINCTANTFSNAAWDVTASDSTAAGTCVAGYTGSPLRYCQIDGTWSTTVSNPCTGQHRTAGADE